MSVFLDANRISLNSDFVTEFTKASKLIKSNNLKAAKEGFKSSLRISRTKEEFLISHLFGCWVSYRIKPFSVPVDRYLEKINIALESGSEKVEEFRLRILCEVLRSSNYLEWCLDAHRRLWKRYSKFPDGLNYLNVMSSASSISSPEFLRLHSKMGELVTAESQENRKLYQLAMYRYSLKLGRSESAIDHLRELTIILEKTPSWVEKEMERLQDILVGKEDLYFQILKGNHDVLSELDRNTSKDLNINDAMIDISAAVVFSSREELFGKVDCYLDKLDIYEQLPVLKFAMAYLPKSRFTELKIPSKFQFIDIALLQCENKAKLLNWLDNCEGRPEGLNLEIIKTIRACPRYLGGSNAVSFNGESSVFRFKSKKVLVIGFCGLHGDMFMPVSTFSYFFEARSDVSHLWLNDVSASNFAKGLPGFGNNVITMANKLKELINEYEFEKVVCIGNSAGGSAAAFFAWHLGADQSIGLSAPTFVDLQDTARNPSALYKGFIDKGINLSIDLRNFYTSSSSPKLTLYYGDKNEVDVKYAENMRGLPNVEHKPLVGISGHSIAPHMIVTGEMQKLINSL